MVKEYRCLIDGEWRSTSDRIEIRNPYDGESVGFTYNAASDDIEDALASSSAAFKTTRELPPWRRAEIMEGVVSGLGEVKEDMALLITGESGKPIRDSRMEVKRAITTFQIAVEETKRFGGEFIPLNVIPGSEKRVGILRRFPVGPVAAITPFNFPLNLVAHKVAPAMAAGNTIVLKPSPRAPLSSLALGKIIAHSGWPKGGINIFLCSNENTEKLIHDDRIKMVTFTGSAEVGWHIKKVAFMKKVTLELGGNAAVIIQPDADMDYAATRCAIGAFSYAGQVCISVQRIFAHADLFDKFIERFVEITRGLDIGSPMNESTVISSLMITEDAAKKAEKWVEEAVAQGAKVIIGGTRRGNLFEPTVITGTTPDMKVSCREVFAPIVVVESYERFDEAVDRVNDSVYGLQAGVFTNNIEEIRTAFERLDVGGVIINDIPTFRSDNMPYGGIKMSGCGREGVKYAMEEMTEPKLLVVR